MGRPEGLLNDYQSGRGQVDRSLSLLAYGNPPPDELHRSELDLIDQWKKKLDDDVAFKKMNAIFPPPAEVITVSSANARSAGARKTSLSTLTRWYPRHTPVESNPLGARMRFFRASVFIAFLFTLSAARAEKPWPIRAVIVTTFETGNDTGDAPGEFQFWVEREHLDEVLHFPAASIRCAPTKITPSSAWSPARRWSTPPRA